MENEIIFGDSLDPYRNLAVEEALFLRPSGSVALYLWQNQNTVVIGKNQCAYTECRLPLLMNEGAVLARRTSGGGAVFHDLGNLNFTFIAPRAAYDVPRQLGVILSALGMLGIAAHASGRNDLTLDESNAKFSGCAFRVGRERAFMHGTLLVSADLEKLSRYLAPPPEKYRSKGVASVRARVENLSAVNPSVDIYAVREALCRAFAEEYGKAVQLNPALLDAETIAALAARNASDEWRLGKISPSDATLGTRFTFGRMDFYFALDRGVITNCTVFSDAMDAVLPEVISSLLPGAAFTGEAVAERISSLGTTDAAEIAAFFARQII